uniref:Secreted protein n=1 Tax=Zea mays TaxID=4577 RepID=C4IZH5_MAIZE|nr:unknown [Zea mays]
MVRVFIFLAMDGPISAVVRLYKSAQCTADHIVHPDLPLTFLFAQRASKSKHRTSPQPSTTLFHGDFKTHSRSRWSIRQLCLPLPAKNGSLL